MPEGATDPTPYATDDLVIDSFELYVANSPLTDFSGSNGCLYDNQKYYLKLHLYNAEKQLIKDDGSVSLVIAHDPVIEYDYDKRMLIAKETGYTTIYATIDDGAGVRLTNTYLLDVEHEEMPDYGEYKEPNVKHVLLKTAETYKILTDNVNYLGIPEFCWCKGNNSLYLKAEASNGTIALFKINGGGVTPTPEDHVTYLVQDDTLFATSTDGSVHVTDGVMTLVGTVEDGVLILNDK